MNRRTTPAAEALRNAVTAHPAGITVFVVDGVERLTFSAEDLARMVYGPTDDPGEARRRIARITAAWRRGEIAGRQVGKYVLFPGHAIAEWLRSLTAEQDRKTA